MAILFECTIPGKAYVKKNTMKIGKYGAYYSKEYTAWMKTASLYIIKPVADFDLIKSIDYYHQAEFRFYFKNHQGESDCSNIVEGVQDCLTKAGIIKDDKYIQVLHVKKIFGEEPRTEIILRSLE